MEFSGNLKEFVNKVMTIKLMLIKLILQIENARENDLITSFNKCMSSLRYMHSKILFKP